MTKIARIFVFFIFIIIFPISIFSKFYVELEPSFSFLNMTDYNSCIDSANKANDSQGYVSKLEKINFSFLPDINVGFLSETDMGLWGFYLKNNAIINYGSAGNVLSSSNTKIRTSDRNFTVFYSGLGARKYYFPEEETKINAYIGLDAGVYYSKSNSINENSYYYDGSPAYYETEVWSSFFAGGDAEAGLDWWFNDILGLNLKTGYRLGMGTVLVNTHSNLQEYDGLQLKNKIDYSGFYIAIGTMFAFGIPGPDTRNTEYEVNEDKPFSELTAEFYNKGVKLFDEGNYEEAEKQFESAVKLDPDSKQINRYLTVISNLKAESSKQNSIEKRLDVADKLRDAGNLREALVKYKELLAIDPANEHALFYIKDFADKSVKFRSKAEEEYGKSDFKAAIQDINKAADYAPEDKEISEIKDRILESFSGKKEADRLFNQAVENFQKGEYEKAVELWGKVITMTPGDEEAKKDLKMAEKKLLEKDKITGESVEKALSEAKDMLDKGILDKAKNKCEYILRMDAGNTEAAQMLEKINEMENVNSSGDTLQKR